MVDTLNTGTMLLQEVALMPESLRFENEPWTRFYLAGENVRKSRKPSGNQSKCASAGNRAHSDKVIDHCNYPRNVGSQPKDDPNEGIGLIGAPVHPMELQVQINPEAQVIEEEEVETFGCDSAIASSSLATEWVKRKRWPSRTRISSTARCWPTSRPSTNVLQPCAMRQVPSELGGRLLLVGSPIF